MSIPHPIPYQGSKRKIAKEICSYFPSKINVFYEPFAGSAAITLYAAKNRLANKFIIGDSLDELVNLWDIIINHPLKASKRYEEVWSGYKSDPITYFYEIRERFNRYKDPIDLLYCITRCVKNAIRFSNKGYMTQSVDKRRLGMHPEKMKKHIYEASDLLKGRVELRSGDWLKTINDATLDDFIYMDPPYLGTTVGRDKRYYKQLDYDILCDGLKLLKENRLRFALSYDGSTGKKTYGDPIPPEYNLLHLSINAGRSTQSTLNGKNELTIESLYLSNINNDIHNSYSAQKNQSQKSLLEICK